MIHFCFFYDNEKKEYYIKVINRDKETIKKIEEKYVKVICNACLFFGRNKRLGKKIDILLDFKTAFNFSENDLLILIRIMYFHKYNKNAGAFLIDYYQNTCSDASFEIAKLSEDI